MGIPFNLDFAVGQRFLLREYRCGIFNARLRAYGAITL
jgi:hypothetical protein